MTDKKLVRREAQTLHDCSVYGSFVRKVAWYEQGLADLAAGRHATGCECVRERLGWPGVDDPGRPWNGCSEIARRMLAFEGYEVTLAEMEGEK